MTNPVDPNTGAPLHRGVRPLTLTYKAESITVDMPGWYGDDPESGVLDANDMKFSVAPGFTSGDGFFNYLKDAFDVLYAEGATTPKMMSVGLHTRLAGRPGRAASLARFLDYALEHRDVWVTRRIDIARHWIAEHPAEKYL